MDKDENLSRGQEIISAELRKNGLPIHDSLTGSSLDMILEEFHVQTLNELYTLVGAGKITAQAVVKVLKKEEEKEDVALRINETSNRPIVHKNDILVEGMDDIKVNLSGCCKPIPGDKIIGYITKGSGITVHRLNCQNITNVDERLIQVKWNNDSSKKYFADLIVHTNTSDNLLDIITKASLNNIIIDSISTINKSEYKVYRLTILVENTLKLDKFMVDLTNLPFTLKVERLLK